MKWSLFVSVILLAVHSVASVIEGKNPEYASKKLEFYVYSDPVTLQKVPVFVLQFDNAGNFSIDVPLNKTTFVFCDFGIYRGMIFLEPSKRIQLLLPPFREKSFADQKNPFFSPVSFWFDTETAGDLNKQIIQFELKYNELTDKFMNQLYFQRSKPAFDTVRNSLQKQFPAASSDFFETYKLLKLNALESDVFRLKSESVAENLKNVKPDYWNQPSFIELFGKIFTNRLSFDAKNMKGQEIKSSVNSGNLQFLINHVKKSYKISGNMADLALLKMLYDGFYSGDFAKNSIAKMVKNSYFTSNSSQLLQKTAVQISEKISFLTAGSVAPKICLEDLEKINKCTNESTDKHKYIVFADTEMIICREQLKYLSAINEKFSKYLEIFVVLKKTDLNKIKSFFNENKLPGIKLVDENSEFIEKYRVKSFPSSYLLNEGHKLVFQETKSPLDGFEQQFGGYIQRELFERQRNQKR